MRPDSIEVSINEREYPYNHLTPALWEMWIVEKLKEAGVPIRRTLLYGDLASGTLFRLDDPEHFGRCKYVWRDDHATP